MVFALKNLLGENHMPVYLILKQDPPWLVLEWSYKGYGVKESDGQLMCQPCCPQSFVKTNLGIGVKVILYM